jgi:MFS family permease
MLKIRDAVTSIFGSRVVATNIVLVVNAIVWYASILIVLENDFRSVGEVSWLSASGQVVVWSIHFAGLILSAFVGARIAGRVNRRRFLFLWVLANSVLSLTMFGLGYENFVLTSVLVILYGMSFGLGMPICMSNYSDSVSVEYRGRVSGIIMLICGISIFAFAVAPFSFLEVGFALTIWRLPCLFVLLITGSSVKMELKKGGVSFRKVLSQQSFLVYFVPWLLFSFINFLVPLQPTVAGETTANIFLIQMFLLGIFAGLAGFLLDSIGRKRTAITGFILLGLSAAARGIDPLSVVGVYLSAIFDGIAWGLLLVLFILTLWGDLSDILPSEKYYAVGATPFFVSKFIELTVGKQIETSLPGTSLFPFAAFFLFIAVLPLFYATETLPEKTMKDRELKNYLEKAQKFAQKEAEKSQSKQTETNQMESEEPDDDNEENQDEYDEARKMAEKYY